MHAAILAPLPDDVRQVIADLFARDGTSYATLRRPLRNAPRKWAHVVRIEAEPPTPEAVWQAMHEHATIGGKWKVQAHLQGGSLPRSRVVYCEASAELPEPEPAPEQLADDDELLADATEIVPSEVASSRTSSADHSTSETTKLLTFEQARQLGREFRHPVIMCSCGSAAALRLVLGSQGQLTQALGQTAEAAVSSAQARADSAERRAAAAAARADEAPALPDLGQLAGFLQVPHDDDDDDDERAGPGIIEQLSSLLEHPKLGPIAEGLLAQVVAKVQAL